MQKLPRQGSAEGLHGDGGLSGRGEGGEVIPGVELEGGGRGCLTTLVRGVYYHVHTLRRRGALSLTIVICVSKSTLVLFRDSGEDDHTGERRWWLRARWQLRRWGTVPRFER